MASDCVGVIRGDLIFRLMDSKGMPLELINDLLRSKRLAFNVVEFVESALKSKNFIYQTIKRRLVNSMKADCRDGFITELDKQARERQW